MMTMAGPGHSVRAMGKKACLTASFFIGSLGDLAIGSLQECIVLRPASLLLRRNFDGSYARSQLLPL